jgi:membrane protein required for colicin V production
MVFRVVSSAIDRIKFREFDRQLGALFGLLRGALYCVVITFFAVTFNDSTLAAVRKSKSAGHIARLISEARAVMPPELHAKLENYLQALDQGLDPTQPKPDSPLPTAGDFPNLPFSVPGTQPQFDPSQYVPPQYNPFNQPQYQPPQPQYVPYPSGGAQPATSMPL